MGNKTLNIHDSLWDDFLKKAGPRQASEKIRTFIEEFLEIPKEIGPVMNYTPYNFYKCTADECPSLGRMSGFEPNNHWRRCLWCGSRERQTFTLISRAGGFVEEEEEKEEKNERSSS